MRGQAEGTAIFRVVYQPDPRCFFNGDDPLKLIAGLPGLAALRISPRDDWPALETLDPFRCEMRIDALAIGEEAAIRHAFRLVADQVRIAEVPPRALAPQPSPGPKSGDIVGAVLAEQRLLLASTDTPPGEIAGRWGSAAAAAANALRHEGGNGHAEAVAAALAEAMDRHDPSPLLRALDRAVQARQSPGTAAASQTTPASRLRPPPPARSGSRNSGSTACSPWWAK